jgi:hypothetical protein
MSRRHESTMPPTPGHAYAVVWDAGDDLTSGRLEFVSEGLQLRGRQHEVAIPFADVRAAAVAREQKDRLRGLPVLALRLRSGGVVRIATLEGAGVLHELVARFHEAGLPVVA